MILNLGGLFVCLYLIPDLEVYPETGEGRGPQHSAAFGALGAACYHYSYRSVRTAIPGSGTRKECTPRGGSALRARYDPSVRRRRPGLSLLTTRRMLVAVRALGSLLCGSVTRQLSRGSRSVHGSFSSHGLSDPPVFVTHCRPSGLHTTH